MNASILHMLFSSVNRLDKDIEILESMSSYHPEKEKLPEILKQAKIIAKKMRIQANTLQLKFALREQNGRNQEGIVNALDIFYGLQNLVRPEIMRLILNSNSVKKPIEKFSILNLH